MGTGAGRENVAEISRLCRALLTEWALADDPDASPVIADLIAEAGTRYPGQSLQMMAAMLVALTRKLRSTFAARNLVADRLLEDEREHRKRIGDDPHLIDACVDIAVALDAKPRDQQVIARRVQSAAQRYGAAALMALTEMTWQTANSIAQQSRGAYSDALAVIAAVAAAEERDLADKGEA